MDLDKTKSSLSFQPLFRLLQTLREKIKSGKYEPKLIEDARSLHKQINKDKGQLIQAFTYNYYHAINTAYHIFDYFDDPTAVVVINNVRRLYGEYEKDFEKIVAEEPRQLTREKLQAVTYWVSHTFIHKFPNTSAQGKLTSIINWLKAIATDQQPFWGAQGLVAYYLAKTFRLHGNLTEAEKYYRESAEMYEKRRDAKAEELANKKKEFSEKGQQLTDEQREILEKEIKSLSLEVKFSVHQIAIALGLGTGYINAEQGNLTRAIHENIRPARIILSETGNILARGYINLLYGRVLREKGREKTSTILSLLIKANSDFSKIKHERYQARAQYEIAKTLLFDGKFVEAEDAVAKVITYAQSNNCHSIWQARATLLMSRLIRKRADECSNHINKEKELILSIDFAKKAMDQCGEKLATLKVDGFVTLALAYMKLGKHYAQKYAEAQDDSEKNNAASDRDRNYGEADKQLAQAEELYNSLNQNSSVSVKRLAALIYLHRSRLFALTGDARTARMKFNRWLEIRDGIEHSGLLSIGQEIETEINALSRGFFLPAEDLNYDKAHRQLHQWLASEAMRSGGDVKRAAKLVGKSVNWIYEKLQGIEGIEKEKKEENGKKKTVKRQANHE